MTAPTSPSTLKLQATAAALLLFAVYWLTASGAFRSIDEQAVFAVSRNLAYHGRVDESALFWASPYDEQARVGLDGELYSKYGIGHSLLVAGAVALARLIPGAGLASSAMLLNSLATALTAWFLILAAGRLGYSARASVSLGLLYGLATYAWVYAKTMFSEPLVALCWTILVWLLIPGVTARRALLAGVAMAAAVAIRPASIVLAPFFALLLWDRRPAELLRRLVGYGLPIAVVALALLAFNWQRFGDPLQFGYSETFDGSLLAGLAGFLWSADRSIFLFAPPLLAIFWGFLPFVRRHGALGWRLLAIAAFTIVLYALWPVFWGGPVWGPRYVLPVLPLLLLLTIPAVERAWQGRGWPRWAMLLLAVLGVAIQLPGVLWNSLPETQALGQRYPLWTLRPQAAWLDMAWLRGQPQGALLAAAGALLALIALLRPRRWLVASAGAALALASLLLLGWLGQSQLGCVGRPAYAATLARLEEAGRPGDALVLNPAPYQQPLDQLVWFLNAAGAKTPFFGLYRAPDGQGQPSSGRVERLLQTHPRLWLLTEGVGPGDPASVNERELAARAFFAGTEWLEDGFRLSRFAAPLPLVASGNPGVVLGDVAALESWELRQAGAGPHAGDASAPSGLSMTGEWQVMLRWRPVQPSAAPLHTFVQVLDAQSGAALATWDSAPQAGFAPTTAWQPGQVVEERLVLALPGDGAPPAVRLIAGLYDPATGQRLATADGADFVTLGQWP
ncbi:MAG: hypothetical protein IAE85_08255 [Anaerolinea sp.]|nr:hypothetical protein [Anaerolinea sp.]